MAPPVRMITLLLPASQNRFASITANSVKREKVLLSCFMSPGNCKKTFIDEGLERKKPAHTLCPKEGMMMRKLRWLAVVVASFVLSACTYPQPSPDAGGIPADTKSYYYETITALDPQKNPPEVQSRVAESVVEESRSHWFNLYEMKEYHPDTHIYAVQDSDFPKLEVNKSYMFVIEPGQPVLKLCTTEECNKAVEKFKQFEKKG